MTTSEQTTFSQVNDRLKEIADLVSDESMPLEDALNLFEEAVGLGMKASELLEEGVAAGNPDDEGEDELFEDGAPGAAEASSGDAVPAGEHSPDDGAVAGSVRAADTALDEGAATGQRSVEAGAGA